MHNSQPRPHWRGFSFALHPLRVQGFYFALLQCIHIQAFTASFAPSMQLYRTCRKTAHRALQRLFLRFAPFNRPQYQTGKSGYNAACATLEHITAPQHLQRIPKYKRHARTLYSSAQPPIIIRYIRVQRCAPVMDPCQTVQHIADHASPAGSRYLPRPAACTLAPGQRSGRTGWHSAPGGAFQRQGRGTINGLRRISFRAFAR